MINTVPNGTQLTEVIQPLPAKVAGVELTIDNSESQSLTLRASLRVRLHILSKRTRAADNSTQLMTANFSASINASTSVSKFWFEVDEANGQNLAILDNGGTGYTISQDNILFVPSMSTQTFDSYNIIVSVRVCGFIPRFLSN